MPVDELSTEMPTSPYKKMREEWVEFLELVLFLS